MVVSVFFTVAMVLAFSFSSKVCVVAWFAPNTIPDKASHPSFPHVQAIEHAEHVDQCCVTAAVSHFLSFLLRVALLRFKVFSRLSL